MHMNSIIIYFLFLFSVPRYRRRRRRHRLPRVRLHRHDWQQDVGDQSHPGHMCIGGRVSLHIVHAPLKKLPMALYIRLRNDVGSLTRNRGRLLEKGRLRAALPSLEKAR
jgi:hypothetical protein